MTVFLVLAIEFFQNGQENYAVFKTQSVRK